jgi:outer membrane receptor protein involved in Fe transport
MKTEIRAWYKPQVKISVSGNYSIKDKIVVTADLFYIDSQFAKTFENNNYTAGKVIAKELNGVVDANIGLEYRYTKKFGFFLNFNNIASQRYSRWYNYPTQRFGVLGGLSYSF